MVSKENVIASIFDLCDGPTFGKMVEDIYREYEEKLDSFVRFSSDAKQSLYSGCRKYTKLSAFVLFYDLKKKMDGVRVVSPNCCRC